MSEPYRGRFTLASALLLVAATTPGLILLRAGVNLETLALDRTSYSTLSRSLIEWLSFSSVALLGPLSLAVLAMSLWRPPLPRREIIGGPGFVACAAVVLACIHPLVHCLVGIWASRGYYPSSININAMFFHNLMGNLGSSAGLLIAGAWFGLALAGCWQLRPTWTDRFGCVLGVCWIGAFLVIQAYFSILAPFIGRYFNA